MSTDIAKNFIAEHLAKWYQTTREYLFTPKASPGASSGPDTAKASGSVSRTWIPLQPRHADCGSRGARSARARHPMAAMKSFFAVCLIVAAAGTAAAAQKPAPDVLVKNITDEVISIIKQDQDIRAGNQKKLNELVEAKVLPHFDFRRMTALAVGRHWHKASAEQKDMLSSEFRTLLVRTYSSALSTYKNQAIEFKPLRAAAEATEVTVQTQVRQPGTAPIGIDYSMENISGSWKVYDIVVGGVSLVTNYRETFNAEIRDSGVDGLIKSLASKNSSLVVQASATHRNK